jgi:beta-lactamase class A
MMRYLCGGVMFLSLVSSARTEELADTLGQLAKKHAGKIAIAFKHLPSGEAYYLNADEPMGTASLIKFPVLIETYYQVHEGKIKLTDPVTLRQEDKVPGSGVLTSHFSPGVTFPLSDALSLMIAHSDNTATNLVLDKIGIAATGQRMKALGFPNTSIYAKVFKRDSSSIDMASSKKFGLGSTTAREMVGLLELLNSDKLVDAASCKAMVAVLKKCEDNAKFPRYLAGIPVAHKTGSLDDARTDAGLIYLKGGTVALCVLTADNKDTRWVVDNGGNVICADVAKAVADYCNAKYKPAEKAAVQANPKVAGGK